MSMTPKEKADLLFKFFHDKLFFEGYGRELAKKLSTEFALFVCEESARPRSIEFINDVIHELKK